MKIRVNLTVEIDAAAWANEFGIAPSEVREDVRTYVTDYVRESVVLTQLAP